MSEDTHPNAGRASGYTDSDGAPVGENVVNVVTGLVSTIETKLLLSNDKTQTRLNTIIEAQTEIVATQERRFDYLLRQLAAHLEKEDNRHDALAKSEDASLAVLTSVVHRLDEITAYVQQGITVARESKAIAKESRDISREALVIGRAAQLTGLEALSIGKRALGVSESNAKRLAKVEKQFAEVEKTIMALKSGQTDQSAQIKLFVAEIADLRNQITALAKLAETANVLTKETNRLTEETNRLTEEHTRLTMEQQQLAQDVADLKAWRAALEARDHGVA